MDQSEEIGDHECSVLDGAFVSLAPRLKEHHVNGDRESVSAL